MPKPIDWFDFLLIGLLIAVCAYTGWTVLASRPLGKPKSVAIERLMFARQCAFGRDCASVRTNRFVMAGPVLAIHVCPPDLDARAKRGHDVSI